MIVSLLSRRWKLVFRPLGRIKFDGEGIRGYCSSPDQPNKTIEIDSRLEGEEELEVLLHEMGHAANWSLSEEHITQQSRDIAKVLWRLGYRRIADAGTSEARNNKSAT